MARITDWKKIATDLYEKATGCGCCCDYDEMLEAKSAYRRAIEFSNPKTPAGEKERGGR